MRRKTFIIIGVIVIGVIVIGVIVIRVELSRTTESQYRDTLQEGLSRRDAITAALATGDPSALEPLRQLEKRIRQVLATPISQSVSRGDTPW